MNEINETTQVIVAAAAFVAICTVGLAVSLMVEAVRDWMGGGE